MKPVHPNIHMFTWIPFSFKVIGKRGFSDAWPHPGQTAKKYQNISTDNRTEVVEYLVKYKSYRQLSELRRFPR